MIRIEPNFARAYHNRGAAYQEIGEKAKAKADFVKARELGSKPYAPPTRQ
jgi:Flp pilus assembly protein TadD